jgi:hypothetical protein
VLFFIDDLAHSLLHRDAQNSSKPTSISQRKSVFKCSNNVKALKSLGLEKEGRGILRHIYGVTTAGMAGTGAM